MKKILLIVCSLSIAMAALAQGKGMVVIKGTLKGDLKGFNKIYLYTRTTNDSTMIKEGQYNFSFPFTEPTIKMLYPEYIREMHQMYQPFGILIAEPGTYYVTSDMAQGLYASSEVKGPESVVLYRQFEKDQGNAYKMINNTVADLYGKDWYRIDEKSPDYGALQRSSDSLRQVYLMPVIEDLVKTHPNSYASAFALSASGNQIASMEKKEQLLSMLSPRVKGSDAAQKFAGYLQGLRNSKIGSTVSNFTLPDPSGKGIDFASLKGKYVLIDFWASWCAPCRQSFPHMREVYNKYKNHNFEIYSISIDEDQTAWKKAVEEEQNPWLQSLDTRGIAHSSFAVTAVPSTFLIDPQGKIVAKEVGFDANGGSEIEKKIKTLFNGRVETNTTEPKSKSIQATKLSGS
jgi:thiol-disulfide isomerase/thioredoxin